MRRAIITAPALAGAALDDLKSWLGISIPHEDAALEGLLRAALETCEAFTGQVPLVTDFEEVLQADGNWQALATRPVQAMSEIAAVAMNGERTLLSPLQYMLDLEHGGAALVRVMRPLPAKRIAVRFTAGMASTWAGLPEGIRHGVLRLAAHHYRQREGGAAEALPPAAVAALWRPWRRMRVA